MLALPRIYIWLVLEGINHSYTTKWNEKFKFNPLGSYVELTARILKYLQ